MCCKSFQVSDLTQTHSFTTVVCMILFWGVRKHPSEYFLFDHRKKKNPNVKQAFGKWCVCVFACVTSKQQACSHVAECEADDGGFVQVSPHRRLQWQKSRQIGEHIGLHATPPPGSLAADGPALLNKEEFRRKKKVFFFMTILKKLEHSPWQKKIFFYYFFFNKTKLIWD